MRADGDHLDWPGGRLTRLLDGTLRFGADFFPDPRAASVPDEVLLPVQAYLLRRPGHAPVLIDTGSGTFEGVQGGGVRRALAALGLSPDDIGAVLLTHMHGDHCGGLIAEGFGTGPIVVGEHEAAYWSTRDHPAAGLLRDASARLRLVSGGSEAAPGITVWSLPGHTPGQVGYVIDGRVALVGDLLHRADIQLPDPRIATKYDVDSATATETRLAALRRIAEERLVFCAGHAQMPGGKGQPFLRVSVEGAGFRASPA